MKKLIHIFCLGALMMLAASCNEAQQSFDPMSRARVDGLNKKAFVCRYKDPVESAEYAEQALQYLNDSLPQYHDGRLRAWNNLSFAYYMLTMGNQSEQYADSVLLYNHRCENLQIEQVIAQLNKARALQQSCRIADSYQLLYDIERQGKLERNRNNYLYNYAQSEYYITSLTLNYSYRKGMEASVASQIEEIEQVAESLDCDFAQDLALKYALAYGYSRLCDSLEMQCENLGNSLDYCISTLQQLTNPQSYSQRELANIIQMLAFLGGDPTIDLAAWAVNQERWDLACDIIEQEFNIPLYDSTDDIILRFYEVSTELFWPLNDNTQRLAACIATGHYCLQIGDTLLAQEYYLAAVDDTNIQHCFLPRFEAMLYDGLLRSGAGTPEERIQWYRHEMTLRSFIEKNQKDDFELQTELSRSQQLTHLSILSAVILGVLIIVLIILIVALTRKHRALKKETQQLVEAQRQDVERIANVETCLSVLRHDITPFMSYLQNKNLPQELRTEVLDQLIRTFNNIKNWTNLSIPTGMQYKGGIFALQEAFEQAEGDINNFHADKHSVRFEPTTLVVNADKMLIEILLRNLVNNAIQHTDEGSITISAEAEGQFAHVRIADTGCGMNDEQLEALFRADKQPNPQGEHSGFGLILSRYIIKKHDDNSIRGCRIWAESQPGHGSTFHFLIALADNNTANPTA